MPRELPVIERDPAAAPSDFAGALAALGIDLRAVAVDTLQINVGKVCNQTCRHCHVDAGPQRAEIMTRETAAACIAAIRAARIPTVDITGGAPELNPSFRWLVEEARRAGAHVMVRHNLTVMFEPGQADLPEFFRAHAVEVVSSLPCYLEKNVTRQRGKGVYDKSIEAIRRLNAAGFGVEGSTLILDLVYNPVGSHLPPSQESLEANYRRELFARFGVTFNRLLTIANMPIGRFLDDLRRRGEEQQYMERLVAAFNPATVHGLMCRNMLSVDWTGRLHDCDFNQMLDLGLDARAPQTIAEFAAAKFEGRPIVTGAHCFGCTAGAGSSCGGSVA